MNKALILAIVSLSIFSVVQAQTPVFIPEGWLYNTNYTGTAQGTTVNGGTTMVPSAPGTNFGIQNKIASPQGGDYIAGHYQGTQNFINYFNLTGFGVDDFVNSSGTSVTLSDGQDYNGVFWMRGNEVADLLAGGNFGFMYSPDVLVRIYDSTGATLIDSYNITVPFSSNGWTEVNVPLTYDAATMQGALLKLEFTRANTDWDYANSLAVPNILQASRLGTTSFDFVQAVPEPSVSLLFGGCLLGGLLFRRREKA